MAISKSIPLAQILVPDRLRAVDEDHALAISKSIAEHGLMNPVTLRQTPNGARSYTLVAGAHRLRGIELLQRDKVDAIVVKADANEAVLLEIAENLFRNDLSVMDRAVFVQTYRDVWEKARGPINPKGGRPKNRDNVSPFSLSPLDAVTQHAASGFSAACADRLGVSPKSIMRLNRIAQNLPREVRLAISGTTIADNQSQLLKLARLEPEKRAKAHIAIREAKGDFGAAINLLDPPARRPNPELKILSRLIDAWERAKPATRKKFLAHAGLVATAKGSQS
jgi:ParB family chromosome partitioning protein